MLTVALSPTACAILLARVLKAPHCLQASITTTGEAAVVFWRVALAVGFVALTAVDFLAAGTLDSFLAGLDAVLARGTFGAATVVVALAALLFDLARVERRGGSVMVDTTVGGTL